MAELLWQPTEERKRSANVTKFMEHVNRQYGKDIKTYPELYKWSVDSIPDFWASLWDYCEVKCSKKYEKVVEDLDKFPGTKWFVGARLNFAENLLRYNDDRIAFTFLAENKIKKEEVTYQELYDRVARMAKSLREAGVQKGDRVVAYMPNLIETVVAMLASSSIGAIWAACGPELGIEAVLDRFAQLEPKVLFASDGYFYKGKVFNTLSNVAYLSEKMPFIEKIVVSGFVSENPDLKGLSKGISYNDFISSEKGLELSFAQLPPDHPHIILFSSGVTGKPKCIVHSLGGTLLAHLKSHILHFDIKREDTALFISSPTWMVWSFQLSCLATGCKIVLFDGNPFYPHFESIWEIIQDEKVSILGCGASFILNLMQQGIKPREKYDLLPLKAIFQSAAPLPPDGFKYIYESIKNDLCFLSGLGGTDVQCGIVEGTPLQPVYMGQMSGPALGFATKVYDENGRQIFDKAGELIVEKPFPSVPLYFWGDHDGQRFKETYFGLYENIWRHGDYAIHYSDTGGIVGLGRSDFVLKPSGVRIGPAEIYNIVENMEGIVDSLVVGQYFQGDQRIILFIKLKEGYELTDELKGKIKKELLTQASPRHVPDKIIAVPEIPYTVNMKKVESAVYNIVNGRPVLNMGALMNPECLALYEKIAKEELQK